MKKETKRILVVVLYILLALVVLLEYFALFWFWTGDGAFMLFSVPAFFLVFLLVQRVLCVRGKGRQPWKNFWIHSMVVLTPVLAVGASCLLAWILGIRISIM